MSQATATLSNTDISPARPKREKAKRFAKDSAALLGVAFSKIVSRTLWWAGWGGLLGLGVFVGWWVTGSFTQPWPWLEPWLSGVLCMLYLLGGVAALGYAGFWRGVGRFALYLGVERGMVSYLLQQILTRLFAFLRKSSRVNGALEASDGFLKNIPLKTWETTLKKSVGVYLAEDDLAFQSTGLRARLGRHLRSYVAKKIESLLLARVRAEASESGGGGISISRVEAVAYEETEELFSNAVLGAMKSNTLLSVAVFVCGSAVIPMICYGLLHWQQGVDMINTVVGVMLAFLVLGGVFFLNAVGTKLGLLPTEKIGG